MAFSSAAFARIRRLRKSRKYLLVVFAGENASLHKASADIAQDDFKSEFGFGVKGALIKPEFGFGVKGVLILGSRNSLGHGEMLHGVQGPRVEAGCR